MLAGIFAISGAPVASLGAMLMTLAQSFEDEVFFVDSNGYLEMDACKFGNLAAELNPDVDSWRE